MVIIGTEQWAKLGEGSDLNWERVVVKIGRGCFVKIGSG